MVKGVRRVGQDGSSPGDEGGGLCSRGLRYDQGACEANKSQQKSARMDGVDDLTSSACIVATSILDDSYPYMWLR